MKKAPLSPRRVVGGTIVYLGAIAVAAAVSASFIVAMHGDAVVAIQTIITSSLGSFSGIAQTLNKICPLLLGSFAVMLGMCGGFVNIGVDGQIYLGAIAATGLGFALTGAGLPAAVMVPAVLLAGTMGRRRIWRHPRSTASPLGRQRDLRHRHAELPRLLSHRIPEFGALERAGKR